MKAILYIDDTPLAALAALNETWGDAHVKNPASLDFLAYRQDFRPIGRDQEEIPVFAVWYPAPETLLIRIVESFCTMYGIPHSEIKIVPLRQDSLFLRFVAWLYRHGLNRLARNFLSLTWPRAGQDLVAHFQLSALPPRQGLTGQRRKR